MAGVGPPEGLHNRIPARVPRPGLSLPRLPKQSQHMEIHYGWPMRCALTISGVVWFAILGISLLNGVRFDEAWKRSGTTFLYLFASLAILGIGGGVVAWVWLTKRQTPRPVAPRPPRPRSRPIPMRGHGQRRPVTREEKRDQMLAKIGQGMRNAGERLLDAPPPRSLQRQPAFAQEVQPVVAARTVDDPPRPAPVRSETERFYDDLFAVTSHMFKLKLTRESFGAEFTGIVTDWQGLYAEYKEIWTTLGWVEEDGRGEMHFLYEEPDLYKLDRNLYKAALRAGYKFPDPPTPSVQANNFRYPVRNQNGTKTEPKPITNSGTNPMTGGPT